MSKLTEIITEQQFVASQINHMRQIHAQITKKDSKDIKDLSAKGNIEADLKLLVPIADQLAKDLFVELEEQLPEGDHFRFLPSTRKPKQEPIMKKL